MYSLDLLDNERTITFCTTSMVYLHSAYNDRWDPSEDFTITTRIQHFQWELNPNLHYDAVSSFVPRYHQAKYQGSASAVTLDMSNSSE